MVSEEELRAAFNLLDAEKKGEFTFEIEQAMRYGEFEKIQHLNNIKAIGLSIQKQNE